MIKAINIGNITDANYKNKYNKNMQNLSNLNKINIFIGENNSGKSRLLRHLVKSRETKIMLDYIQDDKKREYDNNIQQIKTNIKRFDSISDTLKITIKDELFNLEPTMFYCEFKDYLESLNIPSIKMDSSQKSYYDSINSCLNHIFEIITKTQDSYRTTSFLVLNVTYIPILRGIENFNRYYKLSNPEILNTIMMDEKQRTALNEYKQISKHIYEKKISETYSIDKSKIFTAENLFDEIVNKLLGEESGRNFVADFENFISDEFYQGKGFTIIPQYTKGYLNVKIGKSSERPLHDLGDGIKQLITILYKIYEKRNVEAYFLIEEPELNLHPGYQRRFIEILQNNKLFERHQYFITTHSNHIVDNCFDYNNISIYKFINSDNNNNSFKVINTSNNDIEVLEMLGVNNSSIFVSNCTIWVEGISDKILISKYLMVYMKSKNEKLFKEDIHYAFIEYGGNNITHWSFIDTEDIETINASGITNKSFIILDNDNDAPKKSKRKENLKNIFKENYYELTVREIENTIKQEVLETTLFDNQEVVLKNPEEKIKYADKKTYMGNYIDSHYDLKKHYSNGTTGSIRNKLDFAKRVSMNINDINDLSTQAKNLCEKLYTFIKNSNK